MSQDNNRKMKDSGIPWMPSIPDTWEVRRGKNILVLNKRPVRESDEVVTCFRDGEVILRSERRTDGFTMSDKEIGYQGINKEDIVIHGMDGFAGAMGVSKSTGKGSPVLVVCSPKYDAVPQFIIYYLRTLAMTNVFVALSTGIRERSCDLRWNKIAELQFALPSSTIQQRIADFLDLKCAEIDELAALQETMIAELKRYKQSVITEAVTKGLDTNVAMKDSGVEWIGEIPEGWEVKKVKQDFIIIAGATPKSDDTRNWDGDIPWITPADYTTEQIYVYGGKRNLSQKGYDSCSTSLLPQGCLIFSKRAPIGLVALNAVQLCTNQGCLGCVPKDSVSTKFVYYTTSVWTEQFELYGSGTTFKEISANNFANFKLAFPSLTEQRAIADYLDRKCAEIDELIAIKQQKIEALKEYKKSVIFEYVTGKKEI